MFNIFTALTKAKASEVNQNFNSLKILQIYTGTGFDVNLSPAGTPVTNSEEFVFTSGQVEYSDYLEIFSQIDCESNTGSTGAYGEIFCKIEIKETGGSYGTVFDYQIFYDVSTRIRTPVVSYYHLLTAGQKSNGVTVQITLTTGNQIVSGSNIQTVFKVQN